MVAKSVDSTEPIIREKSISKEALPALGPVVTEASGKGGCLITV